jgi:hypothetical protein
MSPPEHESIFPALPCNTIVYRALTRSSWINKRTKGATSAAFIKRPHLPDKDPDRQGLSTFIAANCSLQQVYSMFSSCFGVVTLHVGRLRDIGLDICQDTPIHANITGLPYKEGKRSQG